MAANIELKYFNTFWLKKIKSITQVNPETLGYLSATGTGIEVDGLLEGIGVGQEVTISYDNLGSPVVFNSYITEIVSSTAISSIFKTKETLQSSPPVGTDVVFGKIINFDQIPQSYTADEEFDWLIEESRITGGYNNTSVDFGVKAYIVEDEPKQSHKFSGLMNI